MLRNGMNFLWLVWSCVLLIQFKSGVSEPLFLYGGIVIVESHTINSSEIKSMLVDRNVTQMFVYVTDTFYVDDDLKLNGVKELQIFASTWNIIHPVTFDLSGANGESHESMKVKGSAGNNGYPGINGGNFFGLANKTINGDYLTIISNGGNGGHGQDGTASDDVYVLLNAVEDSGNTGWFSNGDLRSYYKKYFDDRGYASEISDIDDSTSLYAVFVHDKEASFNIRLHSPKCCGTTGIGGAGGHEGRGGKLIFKHVGKSDESIPNFLANNGSVGESGETAKACEDLALDVRVDTEIRKVVLIALPLHHSFSSRFTIINHTKSSKCSAQYVANNETIAAVSKSNEIDVMSAVLDYKRFLIENMDNASLTTLIQDTYKAIDENREIKHETSLRGLVLEAGLLEKDYFKWEKTPELIQLYQRFADRVKSLKAKDLNEDDKRAKRHLKSIFEMKLRDMREDYSLIVNLELFTEAIISSIDIRNGRHLEITNVDDKLLEKNLNLIQKGVSGNYILGEYRHLIEGFRITHFPFAVEYLESYNIAPSPMEYDDLDDIAIAATNKLKELNDSIREIESSNSEILMNLNYIDDTHPRNALFIWKNSVVRDEIRKLFDGKKVSLFADAKQPREGLLPKYNAMKFKTVDIVFRSSNRTANDQLNNLLKYFMLELNHTGQAITRCNNHFYKITTEPIPISISFDKYKDRIPYTRSGVYDLLRENAATLSPFALWEIQIEPIENYRSISALTSFAMFDFDIELHATGKFIVEDQSICENKDLANFYTEIRKL